MSTQGERFLDDLERFREEVQVASIPIALKAALDMLIFLELHRSGRVELPEDKPMSEPFFRVDKAIVFDFLRDVTQAARDAGAEEAWAELFDFGRELGVAFRKPGMTKIKAVRFKATSNDMTAEVAAFVRGWASKVDEK